jgi:hypothetical protein
MVALIDLCASCQALDRELTGQIHLKKKIPALTPEELADVVKASQHGGVAIGLLQVCVLGEEFVVTEALV